MATTKSGITGTQALKPEKESEKGAALRTTVNQNIVKPPQEALRKMRLEADDDEDGPHGLFNRFKARASRNAQNITAGTGLGIIAIGMGALATGTSLEISGAISIAGSLIMLFYDDIPKALCNLAERFRNKRAD